DIGGRVPPEAICLKLFEPEQGVVADELAYFGSAVVRSGVAPRRGGPVVVVEVDAAAIVSNLPAVEVPQVEIARTEVIVDHVHDDGEAVLVRGTDEAAQRLRAADAG